MLITESPTFTVARDEQLENANGPISVTALGIITLVRAEPQNAYPSIFVTDSGIMTSVRLEQLLKAPQSILVTDSGIVIDSKD